MVKVRSTMSMSTRSMEVVRSEKIREFQFVPRIKGAREIKKMTAARFASIASSMKGKPEFTLQEYFKGDTLVHPYYDLDAKYKKVLTGDELSAEKAKHLADFKGLMEKLHPGKDVEYAERHGPLQNAGEYLWKISYRAFVMGVKCPASFIPKYARAVFGLGPKDVHPVLDFSVYKEKEQLLGVIFGCKDIDVVKRFLTPLDKGTSPSKFLAQNYDEDDVDLIMPASSAVTSPATAVKKRGRPKKVTADTTVAVPASVETEGQGSIEVLEGPPYKEVLDVASSVFSEHYLLRDQLLQIRVDRERKCFIFPTTEKWCFIKRKVHAGNNPYIIVSEKGAKFKCFDEECKDKEGKIIAMENLPTILKDLYNKIFYGDQISDTVMDKAKSECADVIKTHYPDENPEPVHDLTKFVTPSMFQKCIWCHNTKDIAFEHSIDGWGVRCQVCQKIWPSSLIKHDEALTPNLIAALTQFNVSITVNNNTLNVTNNYGVGEVDFYADYNNDKISVFPDPVENELFIASLQGTDTSLSRFATYHFRDHFHCTSEKKWYRYRGHCWREDAADLAYKEALNKIEFLRYYQKLALHFENLPIQTDEIKKKARMLRKLSIALEDGKQRDRVVTDSMYKFHEMRPEFASELNTQNVMVFEDGVYDFDTATFGPGTPDRAITMCVPQPYIPFDESNEHIQFLLQFMRTILPDHSV